MPPLHERTDNPNLCVHEESYRNRSLISAVHKNRLRLLERLFDDYIEQGATWADFGCSNGFIIQYLSSKRSFASIRGYDHNEQLLEMARAKNIPNAIFEKIDLNRPIAVAATYDVVSCFETLEHVGDYKTAFHNIFSHVRPEGILMIAVPVEIGIAGIVKFFGRSIARKNPYSGFFKARKTYFSYMCSLFSGGNIESYRDPPRPGWGPHLGFDHRRLKAFIQWTYIEPALLRQHCENYTFAGMNTVLVYRRASEKE